MFDQFRAGKRERLAPDAGMPLSSAAAATFPGGYDPVATACTVIIEAAGATSWPLGKPDQRKVLRRARARTHPDLHAGDRAAWDRVEDAARTLRLA